MTAIKYVSAKEMADLTGMPNALGYTKSGNILIRRGLDKATEKKVRRHEAEHVARGEEGPFIGAIAAAIGGSLISGILGKRSSKDAANAQTQANAAAIEEQRRQFDTVWGATEPGRNASNYALDTLRAILSPDSGINVEELIGRMPGHQGIVDDTMRNITQGASASGSTGGNVLAALSDRIGNYTGDKLFNSLFGLAGAGGQSLGIGANASGNAAANIGNLMQSSGVANASGIMGGANSTNSALQNIMQMLMLRGQMGGGGPNTPPFVPQTPSNAVYGW